MTGRTPAVGDAGARPRRSRGVGTSSYAAFTRTSNSASGDNDALSFFPRRGAAERSGRRQGDVAAGVTGAYDIRGPSARRRGSATVSQAAGAGETGTSL